MRKWAIISKPQRIYRYLLGRQWDDGPTICFVMLNPSKADHRRSDRTLNRCIEFARRDGYGTLLFVNLFALRSPYPRDLKLAKKNGRDPVGQKNNRNIIAAVSKAQRVVVAWGGDGTLFGRDQEVVRLLTHVGVKKLWCLGVTKAGHPRHPSRVARDQKQVKWKPRDDRNKHR